MKTIKIFLFVYLFFSVTETLFASESKENKEHIGCEEIFTEIEAEFPAINPEKKLNILRTLLNGGIITIRERTCEYKKISIDLEKIDFETMDEKTLEILSNDSTIQRLTLFRKLAEAATEESDKRADIWSNENIFNLQETLAKYRETEDLANNSMILWLKRFEEQNNQNLEEYITFVKEFLVYLYNKIHNDGREVKKQDINQTIALWEKLSEKALKEIKEINDIHTKDMQEKIRKNTEELDNEKKKSEEARLKLKQEQKLKEEHKSKGNKLKKEYEELISRIRTNYEKATTTISEEKDSIIKTIKDNNKQLQQETQNIKDSNKQLQQETQNIKDSNKQLQQETQNIKDSNKQLQQEIQNIKDSNKQLQQEIQNINNKLKESTDQYEAKLKKANKIIAQYKNKITEQNNDMKKNSQEQKKALEKALMEQKEHLSNGFEKEKLRLYSEFEEEIKAVKKDQRIKNKAKRFLTRKKSTTSIRRIGRTPTISTKIEPKTPKPRAPRAYRDVRSRYLNIYSKERNSTATTTKERKTKAAHTTRRNAKTATNKKSPKKHQETPRATKKTVNDW